MRLSFRRPTLPSAVLDAFPPFSRRFRCSRDARESESSARRLEPAACVSGSKPTFTFWSPRRCKGRDRLMTLCIGFGCLDSRSGLTRSVMDHITWRGRSWTAVSGASRTLSRRDAVVSSQAIPRFADCWRASRSIAPWCQRRTTRVDLTLIGSGLRTGRLDQCRLRFRVGMLRTLLSEARFYAVVAP